MSTGRRLHYFEALDLAMKVKNLIEKDCERVEIAGSIRRERKDIGDVELVAIPTSETDLFGNQNQRTLNIVADISKKGYKIIKNGPKYIKFDLGPCKCDLFLTTPEQWGVIFLLRTGGTNFSHRFVTRKEYGGMMPIGFRVDEGRLWHMDRAMETPEEIDVFNAIGIEFISPLRRD